MSTKATSKDFTQKGAKRKTQDGDGRKSKLTPALARRIVRLVKGGNYHLVAARACGVAAETMSRWMASEVEPYAQFRQDVMDAEAEAEEYMIKCVRDAARLEPQNARWWLERKQHQRWGRRDRVELSGRDGAPLTVQIYMPAEEPIESERGG